MKSDPWQRWRFFVELRQSLPSIIGNYQCCPHLAMFIRHRILWQVNEITIQMYRHQAHILTQPPTRAEAQTYIYTRKLAQINRKPIKNSSPTVNSQTLFSRSLHRVHRGSVCRKDESSRRPLQHPLPWFCTNKL